VLYGGSVKPDNILSFLNRESVSGVLVGGASIDPLAFRAMVNVLTS
jgi:triosephosphate isomerase